jgi:hypothetical protein
MFAKRGKYSYDVMRKKVVTSSSLDTTILILFFDQLIRMNSKQIVFPPDVAFWEIYDFFHIEKQLKMKENCDNSCFDRPILMKIRKILVCIINNTSAKFEFNRTFPSIFWTFRDQFPHSALLRWFDPLGSTFYLIKHFFRSTPVRFTEKSLILQFFSNFTVFFLHISQF